uniref:Reverse transcriptase domain-containing protein n=1 Tax=Tanacetum cinerariifolium TaxID=118510 RepID=A0A6L2LQD8_TANCI|nr:reverse transcriptase domain-containing protein [Tanacetum cinerariifolium]
MQQFWQTIKKIQCTNSYEFLLANKKCFVNADVFRMILDICLRVEGVDFNDVPDDDTALAFLIELGYKANKKCFVNADVFRMILDICLRVEGVDFNDVPDDDTTLAFLIELGYKGPLYKHTNMFVDHMHQPWRTLTSIINKCLSGKTTSNDKLRKSRIDILWGMFKRENVDYPKGKRSQGKKTTDTHVTDVEVFEESEPEPAKKRTTSKKRVKKSVTISTKDNIILDLDIALELGKSISLTKAREAEEAIKVHVTNARIVTKSIPTHVKRRSFNPPKKLKSVLALTPKEQEAADTIKALKKAKCLAEDNPILEAHMKELVAHQGFSMSPQSSLPPQEEDQDIEHDANTNAEKDDKDDDADDEDDDEHINKAQDTDDEDAETEFDTDEIYKYKIHVHKDVDVDMGERETYPSVLKVPVTVILEITNLLPIPETPVSTVVSSSQVTPVISPVQQSTTPIPTPPPPISTDAPTITTVVPESDSLNSVELGVENLEKNVFELKNLDISAKLLPLSRHTSIIDPEQAYKKSPSEILKLKKEHAEKQQTPWFTIKSIDKAALEEFHLKSALYQYMHANKSFNRNPANYRLYHALMEALIKDENAMDKRVADTVKDHKRKHDDDDSDDDEDPSAGPNQGKTTKMRRTKESMSSKKPSATKETSKEEKASHQNFGAAAGEACYRLSRSDPTLLNNSEMAAEGPGDLPVPDLRTMEELCQPSLNGRGGPISPISIQEMNFRLKNDMIQQVLNSCQFHGLLGDDANKHLDKFLHVTHNIKMNEVIDDALRLYLFPHSLTHHATAWFDRLPRNSINTFEQMAKMFLEKYFSPSMVTKLKNEITNFCQHPDESLFEAWERGTFIKRHLEECYELIENMTAHHNDWDTSAQRSESSSSITSSLDTEIAALKAEMAEINKNLMRVLQPLLATHKTYMLQEPIKANDDILKNMQTNMTSLTNSNLELRNMFGQFMKMNTASSSGSGTLPCNTITNPKEDLKGITTQIETAYQGPTIPTTSSSPIVEHETEETKDMVHPTNNGSTEDVQPLVVPTEFLILNSEWLLLQSLSPLLLHPSQSRANINLMPLSVWNKLSFPDFSPIFITLELADRSISRPVRVAEDVFVKVGTFHFLADFVVIDFDADPRVPLILRRSFLKTRRALINVFEAFADTDHAGCQDTRRSTCGSFQFLGDRFISWSSKMQKSAAISSTEAEYIALSKHIDIRYHFIKEHVKNGVIELYFVNTKYQLADIFTKALGRERIEFLIHKLGMRSFTQDTLKLLTYEVNE